jgi:hypothetical protein
MAHFPRLKRENPKSQNPFLKSHFTRKKGSRRELASLACAWSWLAWSLTISPTHKDFPKPPSSFYRILKSEMAQTISQK